MSDADAASTTTASSQSSGNSSSVTTTTNARSSNKKQKTKYPKIFQCTGYGDCRMTFTRSEHLARHIRKHTGERPFRCHCNRTFSRLDNLRQHIQTVHANEQHILHAPPPPPLSVSSSRPHQMTSMKMTDRKEHRHHHHHHHHQPQSHPVTRKSSTRYGPGVDSKTQQPLPPLPGDGTTMGSLDSGNPLQSQHGVEKHRPQPLVLTGLDHPGDSNRSPSSPHMANGPTSPYYNMTFKPSIGGAGVLATHADYYHPPPVPTTPINDGQFPGSSEAVYGQQHPSYMGPSYYTNGSYDANISNPMVMNLRLSSSTTNSPSSSARTSWMSSVLNDTSPSQNLPPIEERPHTWGPSSNRFSSAGDDQERHSVGQLISITEDAHITSPSGTPEQMGPRVTNPFNPMSTSPVDERSKLPSISTLFGSNKLPPLSKNQYMIRPESYPPPKDLNVPASIQRPQLRAIHSGIDQKPLPPLPGEAVDEPRMAPNGGIDMLMQAAGV